MTGKGTERHLQKGWRVQLVLFKAFHFFFKKKKKDFSQLNVDDCL